MTTISKRSSKRPFEVMVWRRFLLAKLQEFHRVHKTPLEQSIGDLHEAFTWLPKSCYAEEAKPLSALVRKKRRGVTRIGEFMTPLLIRLGVRAEEEVKATTPEEASS